jgi:hypothetical protein
MKISFVENKDESKILHQNYVNGIISFDTIDEFADIILNYSITVATFHNRLWDVSFNTYRTWDIGKTMPWKYISNFEQSQILGFDFDDGTPSSLLIENLKDYQYVIAGSQSHMKHKRDTDGNLDNKGIIERFHVFLFLDKPITDANIFKLAANMTSTNIVRLESDSSVMEASRYFKKHSSIIHVNSGGKLIDSEHYSNLFNSIKQMPSKKIKSKISDKSLTPKWYKTYVPMLNTHGQRHNGVVKSSGYLRLRGYGKSEAYDLITSELGSYNEIDVCKSISWAYK